MNCQHILPGKLVISDNSFVQLADGGCQFLHLAAQPLEPLLLLLDHLRHRPGQVRHEDALVRQGFHSFKGCRVRRPEIRQLRVRQTRRHLTTIDQT